ncbi:MAG: hypothetical protein AVDCRST_MAG75-1477, partial [uncultured Propionibacteriaceae bacterium]
MNREILTESQENDPAGPASRLPVEPPRNATDTTSQLEALPRESHRRLFDLADAALFAFAGVSTSWLAYLLLRAGARPGWPLLLLVGFWVVVTYLMLPRLHRILTRLYVPGYFIGRTRTSDGLLGDPVNLAFLGTEAQVHTAMTEGRWTRADD